MKTFGSGDPMLDLVTLMMGAKLRKHMPRTYHFYKTTEPFGFCSNFYRAQVTYQDKVYPTSEHLYQAMKFLYTEPEWAEAIRLTPRPGDAARMGRDPSHRMRPDWEKVKLDAMRLTVLLKFVQNTDIQHALLDTGTAKLVEHTTRDRIWGDGGDGSGQNLLGLVLMQVRQCLRTEAEEGEAPPQDEVANAIILLEERLLYSAPETDEA